MNSIVAYDLIKIQQNILIVNFKSKRISFKLPKLIYFFLFTFNIFCFLLDKLIKLVTFANPK